MLTLGLFTPASYDVLPALRRIWKDSWKLTEVRVDYDTQHLPDGYDFNSYPVTLVVDDRGHKFEIKILSLSVGYGGAGPTDLTEVLNHFGVNFLEDDIFTKRKMDKDGWIRLRYTCI